ncbi:MAG: MBL fold metallo-hydrolase [Deltaproteobacteria bacterium]|nr:MBL fold metallo-hydrolase [Deltaproteobacteria bacterium]
MMITDMERRDFLKYSAAAGVLLAAGNTFGENASADGGKDPAQVNSNIVEVDKVTIWVLTDNYYDALRPDNKITKRYRATPGKSIHAEHGLSYYVETVVNGQTSTCMFDYGLDPVGVLNNLALLGIDIGKSNAFSLSHGHFDHFMAAVEILKQNRPRLPKDAPFYVGEEAFDRRYILRPGGTDLVDLGQLKKEDLEALGLKVVVVKNSTPIIPGAYFTGHIERLTAYEKMAPNLLIKRGEKPEPDDFRGEQGLFFKVKGKGLVILSGCAHVGIVNTVKQAQKVAQTEKILGIMGGFHLINKQPEIIQSTVADIKSMKPEFIAPTHCTGFEAIVAFQKEMPNEFILNTAGTQYTLSA